MIEARQMTRSTMLAYRPNSLPDPATGCAAARLLLARSVAIEKAIRVYSDHLSLRVRSGGRDEERDGDDDGGGGGNDTRSCSC